jgi:hypothetical protein
MLGVATDDPTRDELTPETTRLCCHAQFKEDLTYPERHGLADVICRLGRKRLDDAVDPHDEETEGDECEVCRGEYGEAEQPQRDEGGDEQGARDN